MHLRPDTGAALALSVLGAALSSALLAAGCCELVSLGWSRTVPAHWEGKVIRAPSSLAAAAARGGGELSRKECGRLCGTGPLVRRCFLALFEAAHRDAGGPQVECRYVVRGSSDNRFKDVPLPPHLRATPELVRDEATCRELCAEPEADVVECEPAPPPVPAELRGTPAVVCEFRVPSRCGGPGF